MKPLTRTIIGVLLLGSATVTVRAYFASQKAAPFEVKTVQVSRGPVIDGVSATGALQAVTAVQVGTEISGKIAWLGADFNSIVRKGQVIAKLDPQLIESQVAQARASLNRATAEAENAGVQLTSAKLKHARLEALWTKELISQNEFDAAILAVTLAEAQQKSAAAQVAQATAALEQTQVALAHTVITAPIDGIVTQRNVDVGQTVSVSMSSPTIFTIVADLGQMQLNAGIDESDIARIRPFQSVRFQVDAHPGEWFAGTVTQVRLEPTLAQNVVTYNAVIAVPNPELKLRPGMTASVNIQIASREDVVRIPNAALRFRPTAAMYSAIGQTPSATTNASRRGASGQSAGVPPLIGDDEEGVLAPPPHSIRDRNSEAGTVDALFAPVGFVESDGAVWVYADNRLTQIPVRLGITDGQVTELLGGNAQSGMELVTNVVTGTVRATTPASNGGFFMGAPGGAAGRQGGTGTRSPRG